MKGSQPQLVTTNEKGEEKVVKPTNYIRLLGVNWEQNFTWNSHISTGEKALLPATRRQLGALKYISGLVPLKSKLLLANSLIVSRIVYAITIWGGTYESNIRKLQAVLNKTARWVCNSGRRTSTRILMERCNWLSICELITFHTVLALWKVIWHKIPMELHMKLSLDSDFLAVTKEPRIQTCKLGFLWRAVTGWNALNLEIRSMKSFPKLKKLLRKFLIENRDTVSVLSPQSSPGATIYQSMVVASQAGHSSQTSEADGHAQETADHSQLTLNLRTDDRMDTSQYLRIDDRLDTSQHNSSDSDISNGTDPAGVMDNTIDKEMDRIMDAEDMDTDMDNSDDTQSSTVIDIIDV